VYSGANFYHTIESSNEAISEGQKSLMMLHNNLPPNDGMALIRHNFLPIFVSALGQCNINILDIGGSYGTAYLNCRYSCQNLDIKSTVIELASSILEFEKFYPKGEIDFVSSILKVVDKKFDITYFGSSLQYFEDFNRVLDQAASIKSKFIIITDTPMGHFKTFVCAQVNMKGNVIPRLVFSLDQLTDILSNQGYKLIHRSVNYYPYHNFDNYSYPISDARHMNIIFELV
jgi:putative methyltransferase (TIGR04325 family)